MNREANYELAKMKALMERMDTHNTYLESELMLEEISEKLGTPRVDVNSFQELTQKYDLKRSFVGLAYIQGYETNKIYPENTEHINALKNEVGKLGNSPLSTKFNNLFTDPEFSNPTGRKPSRGENVGRRSMSTSHFSGVIKITNYVFNWGTSKNLADFYNNYKEKMRQKRLELGFGKPDTFYAPNDWRRHPDFRGIGDNPSSTDKRTNSDGSKIHPPYSLPLDANISLYGDNNTYGSASFTTKPDGTQYQKKAIRFGLSDITHQWAHYCLVDVNGNIDEVENSLATLLYKMPMPKDLRQSITAQMSQDEINARNEIMKIEDEKSKAEKIWILDNIAYMVGAGFNKITGQQEPFRWINKDIDINNINVNPADMQKIIDKEVQIALQKV